LPAPNTDKEALAVFQAERYRILRWVAAHASKTQPDGTLIIKSASVPWHGWKAGYWA
jgi:hypothetical protein